MAHQQNIADTQHNAEERYQPKLVTGLWKWLYIGLGFLFLGLAYVGWVMPGIPWSPFVVLASYCFGRSSPRMDAWLMNNKYFGSHLRDVRLHRGIRLKLKKRATFMIILVVSISVATLIIAGSPWYGWVAIPPFAFIGMMVMWFVFRTLPDDGPISTANHTRRSTRHLAACDARKL